MMQAGIIDPTKVERIALQNAASIASLLLTTEALITDIPEREGGHAGHAAWRAWGAWAAATSNPSAEPPATPTASGASRLRGPCGQRFRKRGTLMITMILLLVLILALFGALPTWGHSRNWGYGPSGGVGVALLILLVLFMTGRI